MAKLLSEGAYGCVYRPGVKCDGTLHSKEYLSKIQLRKARTANEPNIGKRLQTLKQYDRYFAPALSVCKAVLTNIKKTEIQRCGVLRKKDKKDKPNQPNQPNPPQEELVSVKLKYVGKDTLGDNLYRHADRDPASFYDHVLDTHIYLAGAIEELVKLRIIHHDIKLNNVMYSDTKHVPIMIDFGVAFQLDELYHENNLRTIFFSHYEKYPPWCPEVMCIASIVSQEKFETKKVNAPKLKAIVDTFFAESPLTQTVPRALISTYKRQWHTFLNTFDQKAGKTVINALLKQWHTWDLYSTHAMYYMVAATSEPPFPEAYQTYLISQICGLPSKRDDVATTITRLEKL